MELVGIEPATLGLENRWRTAFGSSDSSLFFGPDGDECVGFWALRMRSSLQGCCPALSEASALRTLSP